MRVLLKILAVVMATTLLFSTAGAKAADKACEGKKHGDCCGPAKKLENGECKYQCFFPGGTCDDETGGAAHRSCEGKVDGDCCGDEKLPNGKCEFKCIFPEEVCTYYFENRDTHRKWRPIAYLRLGLLPPAKRP